MKRVDISNSHLCLLTLAILLLCPPLGALKSSGEQSATPAENLQGSYVFFVENYHEMFECLCDSGHPSEYDYTCGIYNATDKSQRRPEHAINCSEVSRRITAHLAINCSGCRECVRVDLRELTRKHYQAHDRSVFPPPDVTVENCQVTSLDVGPSQLKLERVNLTHKMEVAQFGIPERPGVGGYYTVDLNYPNDFNESDCWLTFFHMDSVDIWYLPVYVLHRCTQLRSISIKNSPITWVSIEGIMALRAIESLTMNYCNVSTFGDDALQVALEALNIFIDSQQTSSPTAHQPYSSNNLTLNAIEKLENIYNDIGRLSRITYLYDMMDAENISFSLVFGYQANHNSSKLKNKLQRVPWSLGLSYLNLAFNNLAEIPYSLSLFSNLEHVNLSHNYISSLYRDWICWPPPVDNSTKNGPNRHCYWFRGSAQVLKVLDLSYNKIDQIGEIQPWYQVKLAELHLQGNQILNINEVAFSQSMLTKSLLKLNLDNNKLSYFLLSSLYRLEEISVQNNTILNIELQSLPKSPYLIRVKLANNKINAIEKDSFNATHHLESLDLSNNDLQHIHYDSMRMPQRATLGSRVVLHVTGQARQLICDCISVFSKIFLEESTVWRDHAAYNYPRIPENELNETHCYIFDPTQGKVSQTLREAKSSQFLCNFERGWRQSLPSKYCIFENGTHKSPSNCLVACLRGCSCYHSEEWGFSNLQCQNRPLEVAQIVIDYPVKKIDMSNVTSQDNLRRISSGTFKWSQLKMSSELQFLYLNNSQVFSVEKYAFRFSHALKVIFLNDNNIQSLLMDSICFFADSLKTLALHGNNMRQLDSEILKNNCLPSLMEVTLRDNSWQCSCNSMWMKLHSTLLYISQTSQIVSDYQQMECTVDKAIIDACKENKENARWRESCKYLSASSGGGYPVDDEGRLIKLCALMENTTVEQRKLIALSVLTAALFLALLCLVSFAIRRRHRLLAVVRVLVLLKYQRDRQQQRQMLRESLPYDAMLWAADRDQDCLVDVLNCVRGASGGDELELCVPESFLYSDLCSSPLTYFDCPAEGAKFSSKVVVALSERFLDTQYLALLQVIRELDNVGRNPFRDIVFLRLSSRRVSLQRQRHLGPEDVQGFKTLQRILSGSDIVYNSVDWEYRLIERIRSKDAMVASASIAQHVPEERNFEHFASEQPAELADMSRDEQAPLIIDVERHSEVLRSPLKPSNQDWPPFHSDGVCEVFIISVLGSCAELSSTTSTIIENIVGRLSGLRLGTNDAALVASWPKNFDTATTADRFNGSLMKRTRQFVLLLSNDLLNWLKDEAALQVEFQSFLAANTFKRRLLVILVGQVDDRLKARYQALANHRLDDGGDIVPQNWFDATAEDCAEALVGWLDSVLYRREIV